PGLRAQLEGLGFTFQPDGQGGFILLDPRGVFTPNPGYRVYIPNPNGAGFGGMGVFPGGMQGTGGFNGTFQMPYNGGGFNSGAGWGVFGPDFSQWSTMGYSNFNFSGTGNIYWLNLGSVLMAVYN